MSNTISSSRTSTYTEARARAVMNKVLEDLMGLYGRDLISKEQALKWYFDILYVLSKEAADFFEIQFKSSFVKQNGLRYEISDDGSIYEDSKSGGIDYYSLPDNVKVSLFLSLRTEAAKYFEVYEELLRRGWGTNGKTLEDSWVRDRAYSKDGYGLIRNKVGNW